MSGGAQPREDDRIGEVLTRVQLPLDNLEFAVDSYLQDNVGYLDQQTRAMLISVRDNVRRIALSVRALAARDGVEERDPHEPILATGT